MMPRKMTGSLTLHATHHDHESQITILIMFTPQEVSTIAINSEINHLTPIKVVVHCITVTGPRG